jgi:hypothetical protein
MAYSILKSNDFVPEEVEIFREIDALSEKIKTATDAGEATKLTARLHERKLVLQLLLDRRRKK